MGVLSGEAIEQKVHGALGEGRPYIFEDGTWCAKNLRNAAYDLRIARDFLILPDGTRYWSGHPDGRTERSLRFYLQPGEVAFVSSVERLHMPLDLVGNLAPRFRRALEGIMVIGGLLVDPGYEGRLHFQLANIGSEAFEIVPGKTSVAAIQFSSVENPPESARRIVTSDDLLASLFDPEAIDPLPPLAFFPRVGKLHNEIHSIKSELGEQGSKLDSTKRSTDQIVVFGVFLLSITLFTVAIAALIEALASGSTSDAAESLAHADTAGALSHDGLMAVLVLVGVVGLFCVAAMVGAFYLLKPRGAKVTENGSGAVERG